MRVTDIDTTVSEKTSRFYFLNSTVEHWPILMIFGTQHHEDA